MKEGFVRMYNNTLDEAFIKSPMEESDIDMEELTEKVIDLLLLVLPSPWSINECVISKSATVDRTTVNRTIYKS